MTLELGQFCPLLYCHYLMSWIGIYTFMTILCPRRCQVSSSRTTLAESLQTLSAWLLILQYASPIIARWSASLILLPFLFTANVCSSRECLLIAVMEVVEKKRTVHTTYTCTCWMIILSSYVHFLFQSRGFSNWLIISFLNFWYKYRACSWRHDWTFFWKKRAVKMLCKIWFFVKNIAFFKIKKKNVLRNQQRKWIQAMKASPDIPKINIINISYVCTQHIRQNTPRRLLREIMRCVFFVKCFYFNFKHTLCSRVRIIGNFSRDVLWIDNITNNHLPEKRFRHRKYQYNNNNIRMRAWALKSGASRSCA